MANVILKTKSFFDDLEEAGVRVKPSTLKLYPDDPIALSWASYRVWTQSGRRWTDLTDVEASPADREIAKQTRRYYRDRFTIASLKGKQLTSFQQNLYEVVLNENNQIKSDQIGIVMKAPYFYVEDTTLEEFFADTRPVSNNHVLEGVELTLTPATKILMSRRGGEHYNYWFTNKQNHAVLWAVQSSNPLRSLVEGLFQRKQDLSVVANLHPGRRRGPLSTHMYYQLANVVLA